MKDVLHSHVLSYQQVQPSPPCSPHLQRTGSHQDWKDDYSDLVTRHVVNVDQVHHRRPDWTIVEVWLMLSGRYVHYHHHSDQLHMCSIGLIQEFGLRKNQLQEPEGVLVVVLLHYM